MILRECTATIIYAGCLAIPMIDNGSSASRISLLSDNIFTSSQHFNNRTSPDREFRTS